MKQHTHLMKEKPLSLKTRTSWTVPNWPKWSRINASSDTQQDDNNNNNNNNNARTTFMVLSSWPIATARVHPVHLDECRSARRAAADPPTKPTDLDVESACIWLRHDLHSPLPFIITQPESRYSFYRPTEGGRLSQPRHTACSHI